MAEDNFSKIIVVIDSEAISFCSLFAGINLVKEINFAKFNRKELFLGHWYKNFSNLANINFYTNNPYFYE